MISDLKDKISSSLEVAQEQAQSTWNNFNSREKIILSTAGGLFAIALLAMMIKALGGFVAGTQFDSAQTMKDVREIQSLVSELSSLKFQSDQFDRRRQQKGKNFSLKKHIESRASRYNVDIKEITPTRAKSSLAKDANELLQVQLAPGAALEESLRFMESVEDTLGVKMINLSIKPSPAEPHKMDIKFSLAHTKDL